MKSKIPSMSIDTETKEIFAHIEKYRKSCKTATGRRPSSNGKGPTYGEERIAAINKLEKLIRESLCEDRREALISLLDLKLNHGGAQWAFRSPKYYPLAEHLIRYLIYRNYLTEEEAASFRRGCDVLVAGVRPNVVLS